MERYNIIKEKNPREIILLRGKGCIYKKCSFCDYHFDSCKNESENFELNKSVISNISGKYGNLEVINSGSVFELDGNTLSLLKTVCGEKNIKTVHFECHYLYKDLIPELRKEWQNFNLKIKLGLETFDYDFRENVLLKGIDEKEPKIISEYFDEANLLFGISGQTDESIERDILTALEYFERICVNIMCENTSSVKPDRQVIDSFIKNIYPKYKDNERIDILINNTDFGVGD
ncbi:MAG: radical SAM protein [Clostridiales bacterium]|nr:radical SAM protein [Clostridiales bacterium]